MPTSVCRLSIVLATIWAVASPAGLLRADEADDQFAVAAGHYERRQWKLAAEAFDAFLEKYPADDRVSRCVFFGGEALLQLGQLDTAREHFQKYLAREPDGDHARAALFRAGEAAYLANKPAAAKPDLEQFLAKYPNDRLAAYVLPYLGDIVLSNNDPAAAAALFADGLKRFPDGRMQDDCRLGLARALELQKQTDEAERLYLAVAGKPTSALADAAQFHLGSLQYAAGRYEQAVESFSAFDRRLADSPWRPNASLGRGLALLKLGRPAEAVGLFDAVLAAPSVGDELRQQALQGKVHAALLAKDHAAVDREAAEFQKQFPNSPLAGDVRRMLARSLVERKEYAPAVALLEPLAKQTSGKQQDLENRYLLAVAYEGMKRYEEALAMLSPVVEAAEGPLKNDAQLTYGSLLLATKKYAEAIAPLEAFLQSKPTDDAAVKAAGELAVCCARAGRIERAKTVYADLVKEHAGHPLVAPTTELLAEAAYDANDAAWSAELSAQLASTGDGNDYAFKGKLGLGWSQFKAGRLAEAAATFDELLQKNPPEAIAAEAAAVRGRALEQLGQNEPALAMYDRVIAQYPNNKLHADALLSAARIRSALGQNEQAASLCERFVKEHPQSARLDVAYYQWAWALRELNRPAESAQQFEQLRKTCPQSRYWTDATYRLANAAFGAKDYATADRLVSEALDRTATSQDLAVDGGDRDEPTGGPKRSQVRPYALFLRGQIAAAKNDWPKTREAFEAFLKEFPDSPRRLIAEFWIAEAHYRQGDFAAAGPRFDQLAKQITPPRESWMAMIPLRRAQMLVRQNRWTDAQAMAERIAADFPGFSQQYEVDYVLGRCLSNAADFEGARNAYGRVIRSPEGAKTETAAMAQWMIGESYFHQKNYDAALREYLRLEILYAWPTWQAAALLQAGKCHERLGQGKQAAELYQRIVKNHPDTKFAGEAAKRLRMANR